MKFGSKLEGIEEYDEEGELSTVCSSRTSISEPTVVKKQLASNVTWSSLASHMCKMFTCLRPINLASLRSKPTAIHVQVLQDGKDGSTEIKWCEEPFAKGACRWAYHAQIKLGGAWKPCVVKRHIQKNGGTHTKKEYQNSIYDSVIAQYLADAYNEQKQPENKSVRFLTAYHIEVNTGAGGPEYFSAEEALPEGKQFEKYCNNAGSWEHQLVDRTLLDFQKFTASATNGYMLVTDLQGVSTGSEFILTDPAIMCKDADMFGATNLGLKGILTNLEMTRSLYHFFGWD